MTLILVLRSDVCNRFRHRESGIFFLPEELTLAGHQKRSVCAIVSTNNIPSLRKGLFNAVAKLYAADSKSEPATRNQASDIVDFQLLNLIPQLPETDAQQLSSLRAVIACSCQCATDHFPFNIFEKLR